MFFTTFMIIPKHFQGAMIFKNYVFIVKSTAVQPTLLARLATVSVLEAGGKPSTWFPPGGLVEPTSPPQLPRDHLKMKFEENGNSQKTLKILKIIKFT